MSYNKSDNNNIKGPVVRKARKPGLAFLFSFLVPGGGQFYNHQFLKGGLMLGGAQLSSLIALAGAANSNFGYYDDYYYEDDIYYYDDRYISPALPIGGLLLGGVWLWSMIDAPISAAIINKRNGFTGLLDFEKEGKYALKVKPFQAPGLGGSISLRF